jgi:hypothetical protein
VDSGAKDKALTRVAGVRDADAGDTVTSAPKERASARVSAMKAAVTVEMTVVGAVTVEMIVVGAVTVETTVVVTN